MCPQIGNWVAFSIVINTASDLRLSTRTCDALKLHMQNPPLLHKAITRSVHVFVCESFLRAREHMTSTDMINYCSLNGHSDRKWTLFAHLCVLR